MAHTKSRTGRVIIQVFILECPCGEQVMPQGDEGTYTWTVGMNDTGTHGTCEACGTVVFVPAAVQRMFS